MGRHFVGGFLDDLLLVCTALVLVDDVTSDSRAAVISVLKSSNSPAEAASANTKRAKPESSFFISVAPEKR